MDLKGNGSRHLDFDTQKHASNHKLVKRQQIDMLKQRLRTSIPFFSLYNITNILVPNNNYTRDVV
jgi:hypothetical protein